MSDEVTCNEEQRLYVIPAGRGFTCLGYDVARQWASAVAQWANLPAPDPAKIGTLDGYNEYTQIMGKAASISGERGERCPALLTPQLIGLERRRVEVIDRAGERRRFYVGRSSGWLPIHLEVARRDSSGGAGTYGTPYQSVRVIR
jgi:hypothetical protein